MGGTEPTADAVAAADADALFVLTAALLTPARFPSVLGDDYPAACAALGLEPYEEGYGLVLGQDGLGARWTVVVEDVSLVATAVSAWDCGMPYDLSPDEDSVVAGLPGWPLAVVSRAPGVPAPHDPEPEEGDPPPLVPPSGDAWGPAQRRLGADEVALRWADWRAGVATAFGTGTEAGPGADPAPDGPETSSGTGAGVGTRADAVRGGQGQHGTAAGGPGDGGTAQRGTEQGPAAHGGTGDGGTAQRGTGQEPAAHGGTGDGGVPGIAAPDPYDGVRRALAELRGYLEAPPPVGRVRSSFATADARVLRADGPGWSFVARTDDMAFVLLDDRPREVFPVARGPRLPSLLQALDAIAVRPS
ncbi:hypothetical protein GCM10022244_02370 [Streptomyces gulbargensis]|uniref:Integral membrane protein n=1 Tax=Streptomyces gulbargensis TaxID=364901 RepID=A0ABP7L8C4_9ACTN